MLAAPAAEKSPSSARYGCPYREVDLACSARINGLITGWRWGRGAAGGFTPTRSIAGGVHQTEQAKAVRQLAQQHRNDGACWNRRYAAARS